MDRRESLKLVLLCAVARRGVVAETSGQEPSFESRWHEWPDMRWAGPECWGNRLQDWMVREGVLVCRVPAPNRTLHCLTHRVHRPEFDTSVSLDPGELGESTDATAFAGLRVGITGRFPDHRSAAVHGTGLDAGVTSRGRLFVGDRRATGTVDLSRPFRLELRVRETGLTLTARREDGGEVLSEMTRSDLPVSRVIGNVALVRHAAGAGPAGHAAGFSHWRIEGPGVTADPGAAYGPIMFAQYTVHRGVLKLTAQLAPVDDVPGLRATLEFPRLAGGWESAAEAQVNRLSRTARFRVEGWDPSVAVDYRVRLSIPLRSDPEEFTYQGTIAAEPGPERALRAAVFSCNADHGFPDREVVEHVAAHRPHLVLFLGDQFYEGSGGFGIQTDSVSEASLDMLAKWYMFGWSYRDLFRHIPAAFIPDDHDVYHGNVWGEGGKAAPTDEGWGAIAQDRGGYKMPAAWVNAVQQCQTSHLPDPYDPTPVDQGIGVYYTGWEYGGVSFAILEDRKFKSAPGNVLPSEADVWNGWIRNPSFDVTEHPDPPGAELLGERQMRFLEDWIGDWRGPSYFKVVLSQTNFAAVHTIPESAESGAVLPGLPMPEPGDYVEGDKLAVDMDSNGWPRAHRDRVLRLLRRGAAFHIAGDQHLATVVRHGVDEFDDAGFSFTGPALNNIWPRRWWPPRGRRERQLRGGPEYAGSYRDGFGNRVTVHAAANPRRTGLEPAIIRDRATGYGIVVFDQRAGRIRIECWPRHVRPSAGGAGQYEGWPLTITREDGDGRRPAGQVVVRTTGLVDGVVEVFDTSGMLQWVRRMVGAEARVPFFARVTHRLRVGDPERGVSRERAVEPGDWGNGPLVFRF